MAEKITVPTDTMIDKLAFLSPSVVEKLRSLQIRSVRQLYHRLHAEPSTLEEYLDLPSAEFRNLSADVDGVVERLYPADTIPMVPSPKRAKGVAVDRLERPRPKFHRDEDVYIPRKR